MGSDLLKGIRDWKPHGDKLVKEYKFIIMTRPNYIIEDEQLPDTYRILYSVIDGSSTKIRDRISNYCRKLESSDGLIQCSDVKRKKYLGINGLTTHSVIEYIIKNKLYMDEESHKRVIGSAEKEIETLALTKSKSSNKKLIITKFNS